MEYLFAAALLVAAACIYKICLYVYRFTLHPLAGFPGPTLAAATWLYEFYHDTRSGGGLYIWRIEEMHKRYGPVVRINPEELHIIDPAFHETIYAGAGSRRDKWDAVEAAAQSFGATGHTPNHELHRMRKDSMSPFFSKKAVRDREQKLESKVEHLAARLRSFAGTAKPVNLTAAYIALCMDVITEYAFGTEYGLLTADDFTESWKNTIMSIVRSVGPLTHMPWIPAIIKSLPEQWQRVISPDLALLLDYGREIRNQVAAVLSNAPQPVKKQDGKEPTIFDILRDSTKLSAADKKLERLTDEGNVLLIAATETPGKVLALLTYHLIANPDKYDRLRQELKNLQGDFSLAKLESLPYLSGIVREGMRLHGGVINRTKRLAYEALTFTDNETGKTWVIPPRTPMSCSIYFMHYDEKVFPDPYEFKPERWADATLAEKKNLETQYFPFGRGTRSCLGYNLGLALMHLTLAKVVGKFDMKLFETGRRDVDLERDWLIPQPWKESVGVRVTVMEEKANFA